MKVFHLPSCAKMHTSYQSKPLYNRYSGALTGIPDDIVMTGMKVWLEFVITRRNWMMLISEIDISSRNRFYTYEQSDLQWLLYTEPHRRIHRAPVHGEIVEVRIDGTRYNAVLECADIDHINQHITVRAIVLQPPIDISTQVATCLK